VRRVAVLVHMTTPLSPIPSDQLRVTIEVGDDCVTTRRVAAALQELRAALDESDEMEVAGFESLKTLSDVIVSFSWQPPQAGMMSGLGAQQFKAGDVKPDHKDW
jgi:hypothetical protein